MLPILQAVPATVPFFFVVFCWFAGDRCIDPASPSFFCCVFFGLISGLFVHSLSWRKGFSSSGAKPKHLRSQSLKVDLEDKLHVCHLGNSNPGERHLSIHPSSKKEPSLKPREPPGGFMHMYYSFNLTDWWSSGMIMYRLGGAGSRVVSYVEFCGVRRRERSLLGEMAVAVAVAVGVFEWILNDPCSWWAPIGPIAVGKCEHPSFPQATTRTPYGVWNRTSAGTPNLSSCHLPAFCYVHKQAHHNLQCTNACYNINALLH